MLGVHEVSFGARDAEQGRVEGVHAVQEAAEAHTLLPAHALCRPAQQASATSSLYR